MLQKHNKHCLKPQDSDTITLARGLIVRATTRTRV